MLKKEYPSAWVYKPQDICHFNIPDLIICFFGKFVSIELKVPGSDATKGQAYELQRIRNAGGRSTVCHSAQEVREFLKSVTKEISNA